MNQSQQGSITQWIAGLREGNAIAAERLWDRYFDKLVELARRKLRGTPRRVADEEDMALSVFRRLCAAVEEGRYERVRDRDDLWPLLVTITTNRVIDHQRALHPQKRGGGKVRGESAFAALNSSGPGIENALANDPTPEMLVQIGEEHDRLLAALDDGLRQIAVWKFENRGNQEIASQLGITPRSVRRKLERIRELWLQGLEA